MKDEDDFEDFRPRWWQRWPTLASLAGLCVALSVLSGVLYSGLLERDARIAALNERIETGPLVAPSNVRTVVLIPDRSGPGSSPQLTVRRPRMPDLVQLRIDVSFARQNTFRLKIERKDQGRAGVIHNLLRDSNGELQVAVNSSVLYPGTYRIAIEGLVNRGNPVPVGWLTIQVVD